MARSNIEWTEVTWNPTTGCDQISAGCDNCYALALSKRLKAMGSSRYQLDGDERTSGPGFGVAEHPDALDAPYKWRKPRVVFVNSMSDLFHARISTDFIQRVFNVIAETPQHTYQVLTKRPRRAVRLNDALLWPNNLWLGVTVEDSLNLWRIEELRKSKAAVKFVSAEPLLGPLGALDLTNVDWLIAGGESGPNFRPVEERWILELQQNCRQQDVKFFFKQWGGRTPKSRGRLLNGRTFDEMPSKQPTGAASSTF